MEGHLLEAIAQRVDARRRDGARLDRPLRVAVPSRSLRLHVSDRIARRFGAVAGLSVSTLYALALEVLDRAGQSAPGGSELLPILVRRRARAQPVLRRRLDDLDEGYQSVADSVRDLLDAQLDAASAEPLLEAIQASGEPGPVCEVASAVVRVATECHGAFEEGWPAHSASLYQRAGACLEREGPELLPAEHIWVHGVTDATGATTAFLSALQRECGATVGFDRPPAPGRRGASDPSLAFGQRLREVLGAPIAPPDGEDEPAPPGSLRLFQAPGISAEVRELARRVSDLVADGSRPEAIGVVARDAGRIALPLRLHFDRLGVPYSAIGTSGPPRPVRRAIEGMLATLDAGGETPTDLWLDARLDWPTRVRDALRLAFRHLAATRLEQVAALADRLEPGRDLALPVRTGLVAGDEGVDGDGPRAERRRLPWPHVQAAVGAAAGLARAHRQWTESASWSEHVDALRAWVRDHLGWSAGDEAARLLEAALAQADDEAAASCALAPDEARMLWRRLLESAGRDRRGGRGGGVQVLSVMEARARTFDHLFVVGLNRDVFPRVVQEDPLLPDTLRRGLRAVLPDLPVKQEGVEEERFLFAQLLASSPDVTLSWSVCDDDGVKLSRSTLIDRLEWAGRGLEVASAPPVLAAEARPGETRPAFEWAVLAGWARHRGSQGAFEAAIRESLADRSTEGSPQSLAHTRMAIVREHDLGPFGSPRLGPYLGWVGPVREPGDPRRGDLWVTTLEALARCPWQSFLEKLLRIEPLPDPFETLPGLDALMVGTAVHAVLERAAREQGVTSEGVEEAAAAAAVRVTWPDEAQLDAWGVEAARRVLAEAGIGSEVLVHALARRVRPLVDHARALEAVDPLATLAVEAEGAMPWPGDEHAEARPLRFRADRIDRLGEVLLLTDYKTGRTFTPAKQEQTRRRHLLAAVGSGERLQAAVYARAVAGGVGRYLFLGNEPDEQGVDCRVEADDPELCDTLDWALSALLAARESGSFVPRLLHRDRQRTNPGCEYCEVAEACLHHDSGAHRRLRRWIEAEEAEASASTPDVERAARGLLALQEQSGSSR
ncbi:MAG: PD-(D/E)XK nuclease family protein [Myxococcota bacterium]